MIIWVMIFLYSSSVYCCHLFLISSASLRSIPFLSFIKPIFCMKCSLAISNFLEEISSLSHSVVFLYFFASITEEGFLISCCYSLELCIQMPISFLFPFNSKNEGMEPKQKQYPAVDVTGDRSKVRCCKEQHCIGTWNVWSMNQGKLEVVKQEMARENVEILGISVMDWKR